MAIADRPIELIRPKRDATTAVAKIAKTKLWHLHAIKLAQLRQRGFGYKGRGVTVAVLDTGVDESHPELTGRVVAAYTFSVKQKKAVPMAPSQDTDGHGTHVPEVQIVNISAGIPGYLPEMHWAMADLLAVGVLPVIAVGNDQYNYNHDNLGGFFSTFGSASNNVFPYNISQNDRRKIFKFGQPGDAADPLPKLSMEGIILA